MFPKLHEVHQEFFDRTGHDVVTAEQQIALQNDPMVSERLKLAGSKLRAALEWGCGSGLARGKDCQWPSGPANLVHRLVDEIENLLTTEKSGE